jgi:non-canonical (house-cleaning) NTP pyrophosphatase
LAGMCLDAACSCHEITEGQRSAQETRRGARNRAAAALRAVQGAHFGVGMEGGLGSVRPRRHMNHIS